VLGKGFDEYKACGGVFLESECASEKEILLGPENACIENFIRYAIVDNLINTLNECNEDYSTGSYYLDWLYVLDKPVIFKGVIALLQSSAEIMMRKHFVQEVSESDIPGLVEMGCKWSEQGERDIITRIGIDQNSIRIENHSGTIDALTAFLVNIGCLLEGEIGDSDLVKMRKKLYFAHPALMNYATDETKKTLLKIPGIDRESFSKSLTQAADSAVNANIVYCHFLQMAGKDDKIFMYRDANEREIDVVSVNRKLNKLRLIEVKSKSKIDGKRVFNKEAKHLYDDAILGIIGVSKGFSITRIIAYNGDNECLAHVKGDLFLVNFERLLCRIKDLDAFIDEIRNPSY
jgi:hypothetical protein